MKDAYKFEPEYEETGRIPVIMNVVCTGEKPTYANEVDLRANEDVKVYPGQIVDIESMLAIELPSGHFGMIVARSGLSFKYQIKLINDVGIIDEDFRGNIGIRLINEGKAAYEIKKGDRIAQMLIIPYIQVSLNYVEKLSDTERGKGGFGHTGK